MAGGSGTRFWPLSRKSCPKQFLAIGGEARSMLRATAERVLPLCGWERLLVVASRSHARPIRRILPELPAGNLLIEPCPRNTAPAVGLASLAVHMRDPDGYLAVLPSDHIIRPAGSFRGLLRAAFRAARSGALVTLGVRPTRAETGYGYIRVGTRLSEVHRKPVFDVRGFTEKPDRRRAAQYLRSGDYYWNSGMFIFRADAILGAVAAFMPGLHAGLEEIRHAPRRARRQVMERVFEQTESISIDYGVMEKSSEIVMLPWEHDWSDVGSWAALPGVLSCDRSGNTLEGDTLAVDCRGCVIRSSERLVSCVGLRDLIVVETADAVLVCPIDQAQAVRRIVEKLERQGRDDVL
ncbi:MAG: mannose-1-phosphate guanylyltransferase [Deltaproteobacteria bacterium]|nr:mannose-1-phosphate guanylyltransferase [Deltaproteobacteria bacterium]